MPQSASLIDLDALPDEVRRRVQWELERAQAAFDDDRRMRDACATCSDADLIAYGEREYRDAPIGLSTWYDRVLLVQETVFNRVARNGARRPVFMRGAKQVLIRRYCLTDGGSSHNGWAARVFWRAVKMAKITALDRDEFAEATMPIRAALKKRYHLTTPFDRNTGWDVWGGPYLIRGKPSHLEHGQIEHIKMLRSIQRKFDKLEERRAAIRAVMLGRLAA